MEAAWRRALAYVGGRVAGPPLPGGLDITVHFHPDRLVGEVLLLRHLAIDGTYRSQFETGTGNGGLTAYPGGDRWRWEQRMFGGCYDDAPVEERPKYGALNHRRRAVGAAPRFGSAHLRLAPHVLPRTTFCYPDSFLEPVDFGTADHMPLVGLALAADPDPDPLDDYVEAHVHGPLLLARDVAALVLDPSHRGTDVEQAASALPVPTEWHEGFRLDVEVLATCGRATWGDAIVDAGLELVEDGRLDARIIGDAARAGRCDPDLMKRLWHCTVRFGFDR